MASPARAVAFRGTAHPAPHSMTLRTDADMTPLEIASARMRGTPICVEHDTSRRVGTIDCCWEGPAGELRVAGKIEDALVAQRVDAGHLRGLSLATEVLHSRAGDLLRRNNVEVSLCATPARDGCFVDVLGGVPVRQVLAFARPRHLAKGAHITTTPGAKCSTTSWLGSKTLDMQAPACEAAAPVIAMTGGKSANTEVSNPTTAPVSVAPVPSTSKRTEREYEQLEETIQSLKRQADSNARVAAKYTRERSDQAADLKPVVRSGLTSLASSCPSEKDHIGAISTWAGSIEKTVATDPDAIDFPMFRAVACFSQRLQTLEAENGDLQQVSANVKCREEEMGKVLKEKEAVDADNKRLQQKCDAYEEQMREAKARNDKLKGAVDAHEMAVEKRNFSKASSRESGVDNAGAAAASASVDSGDARGAGATPDSFLQYLKAGNPGSMVIGAQSQFESMY